MSSPFDPISSLNITSAIEDLTKIHDEWLVIFHSRPTRWPANPTLNSVLDLYADIVAHGSSLARRVGTATRTLVQAQALDRPAPQTENWVARAKIVDTEIQRLNKLLVGQTAATDDAQREIMHMDIVMVGIAKYMTTNRISYFERINAGIAPARDDDNPRMHPELVLSEDSDIASMRTLQPGSHGFAFPIHDPLLSALLTTPKFRVLLQRGKARIYCGLYRADAWREMDVLAPEFLHMSAETRTHVVARMASSAPGSDPFNELYKDLALSTRVIPCVLLQCLRPHSSVYVDPRVRRAPPGLPAASSSGVGVYQRTAPPPPPSSQSEDPSSRMLYATRDSSQWAPAPGSPGGGYQAPYVASGARI